MDGPRGYHTEWSKSDREVELSYDFPYMWDQKEMIQVNLQNRMNSQTESEIMIARGKG